MSFPLFNNGMWIGGPAIPPDPVDPGSPGSLGYGAPVVPVLPGTDLDSLQIRNLLSGRYAPVCERFRYYLLNADGEQTDISDGVTAWSMEFDSNAEIMRTGSVTIDTRYALYRLSGIRTADGSGAFVPPNPRNFKDYAFLVYWQVRGPRAWYSWPVGAFKFDTVNTQVQHGTQSYPFLYNGLGSEHPYGLGELR